MEARIERYPTVDLTKWKMKTRDDLQRATASTFAEINKWLIDHGETTFNDNSILMNKLIYFISAKVKEVNPSFVRNTGWYMYGPCYEEGRRFELEGIPIAIKPVAENVSPIVGEVCEELIPRFRKDQASGTVMSDFLKYIYEEKCDEPDFRDYYLAKHELLGALHRFNDQSHIVSQENPTELQEKEMDFQSIFFEGDYCKLVGLKKDETNSITDFVDVVFEYLDLEMDKSRQLSFRLMTDIFKSSKNILLAGLSHLNYSKTFQSFNRKYQEDVQRDQSARGHQVLCQLEEERKRISRSIFDLTYVES